MVDSFLRIAACGGAYEYDIPVGSVDSVCAEEIPQVACGLDANHDVSAIRVQRTVLAFVRLIVRPEAIRADHLQLP